MSSTQTSKAVTRPDRPNGSRALVAAAASAIGAGLAAAAIAALGVAVGVDSAARQLQPGTFLPLAVLGAIAGAVGWYLIAGRATEPRRMLGRLVPAVLVLSFVPDLLLGISGAADWGVVATLMVMHLAVALVALPVFARVMPVPAR